MPKPKTEEIKTFFQTRTSHYKELHQKHLKNFNLFANIRLLLFLFGISGCVFLYINSFRAASVTLFFVTVFVFQILVAFHTRILRNKNRAEILGNINHKNLKRLEGSWGDLDEAGLKYKDSKHRYSSDLDIFGSNSLFQFLNTTTTFLGELLLAERLSSPIQNKSLLIERQEAIQELGKKIHWCHEYESEGLIEQSQKKDPSLLLDWSESMNQTLKNKSYLIKMIRFLPLFTGLSLALTLLFKLSLPVFSLFVFLHFTLTAYSYIRLSPIFEPLCNYQKELDSFVNLIKAIEKESFSSAFLSKQKEALLSHSTSASKQIAKLNTLIELTEAKHSSIFHFFLNLLFLWDYQCFLSLESWKTSSGQRLREWLNVVASFEELSSFSVLATCYPQWTYPDFVESSPCIIGHELGHPLIHERERVCNDLEMNQVGKILMVTGSNMSGKSTFLRTVGINLVLAYAGAPVCAKKFVCSIMNISTSMRISDSLENHVSSFYAEVLRIKSILNASCSEQELIFLIDELFKGTNSHDRQHGAEIIIKKLNRPNCLGLVSTHDLALAKLAEDPKLSIKNFHFKETYQSGSIQFDYKLCPGISETTNGLYLLKMVGIIPDSTA